MTMMSPCEKCARAVRLALEKEGYQVIGFHAAGIGDRAMEDMVGAGLFPGRHRSRARRRWVRAIFTGLSRMAADRLKLP